MVLANSVNADCCPLSAGNTLVPETHVPKNNCMHGDPSTAPTAVGNVNKELAFATTAMNVRRVTLLPLPMLWRMPRRFWARSLCLASAWATKFWARYC